MGVFTYTMRIPESQEFSKILETRGMHEILYLSMLCMNIQILLKFYWSIIGRDTIVPRILRLRGTKDFLQTR